VFARLSCFESDKLPISVLVIKAGRTLVPVSASCHLPGRVSDAGCARLLCARLNCVLGFLSLC